MKYLSRNRIIRVITIALTFFVSVFAISGVSAQTITATEVDNNPVINITARVVGCGDGVVQTGLGEQCDGADLNGQSCATFGFTSGVLTCRPSCIFETSACFTTTGGGGSSGGRGGGGVRDVSDIFGTNTPDTNVVFTGSGEPNSTFFVSTADGLFTSVSVDSNGDFSITVSEPTPGDYTFTFYTLSPNGLFGPRTFSTPIQQYATTYINNIFIPYAIEELLPEEVPVPVILDNETVIPSDLVVDPNSIDGDLYAEFLDILAQNDNLSPDELRNLIRVFSEQHGYEAKVPGYTTEGQKRGLIPYIQRQFQWLPDVGKKWYPNVYISFMEPYRVFFYEITDWFSEFNNPVTRFLL